MPGRVTTDGRELEPHPWAPDRGPVTTTAQHPPGYPVVPDLPARLPVLATPAQRRDLRAMVVSAVDTELPIGDVDAICYLIRRAHGSGISQGRK